MKFTFAILGLVSAHQIETLSAADYKFMEFVSQHGRSYATKAEFEFRAKIFKNALIEIEEFNAS
jgi:tyrosine-protein phosphatase YwqE